MESPLAVMLAASLAVPVPPLAAPAPPAPLAVPVSGFVEGVDETGLLVSIQGSSLADALARMKASAGTGDFTVASHNASRPWAPHPDLFDLLKSLRILYDHKDPYAFLNERVRKDRVLRPLLLEELRHRKIYHLSYPRAVLPYNLIEGRKLPISLTLAEHLAMSPSERLGSWWVTDELGRADAVALLGRAATAAETGAPPPAVVFVMGGPLAGLDNEPGAAEILARLHARGVPVVLIAALPEAPPAPRSAARRGGDEYRAEPERSSAPSREEPRRFDDYRRTPMMDPQHRGSETGQSVTLTDPSDGARFSGVVVGRHGDTVIIQDPSTGQLRSVTDPK